MDRSNRCQVVHSVRCWFNVTRPNIYILYATVCCSVRFPPRTRRVLLHHILVRVADSESVDTRIVQQQLSLVCDEETWSLTPADSLVVEDLIGPRGSVRHWHEKEKNINWAVNIHEEWSGRQREFINSSSLQTLIHVTVHLSSIQPSDVEIYLLSLFVYLFLQSVSPVLPSPCSHSSCTSTLTCFSDLIPSLYTPYPLWTCSPYVFCFSTVILLWFVYVCLWVKLSV